MTPEIEKHLKKTLRCTEKSSERVYFAAFDVIQDIVKLGKRKKHRTAAIEALQKLGLEAYSPLRGSSVSGLAELMTPDDTACLSFLRKGLKNNDIDYGCVCGLLKILGRDAYEDISALILNKRRPLDSRSSALSALCDHSGQAFDEGLPVFADMKPSDLPVAEIRAWVDAGFPDRAPQKIDPPVKGLAKLGIELPDDYLEFLTKHRASDEYEFDDCNWEMTEASKLLTKTNIDGKKVANVQQLKRFAATLEQSLGMEETEDGKGKPYSLERLAGGIAIGSDDTGDVMYLDPADRYSVWIFHHDGMDVEKVAKTFRTWLRKADKL